MLTSNSLSRRSLLALAGSAPLAWGKKKIPVGLELYSVRDLMAKDLFGTVTAVAKLGYPLVEFYGPYFQWKEDYAKQVRKLMDDLGIKCWSTHNGANSFDAANQQKAIDLNSILGSKYIVMASAGRVVGQDGWKKVAEKLNEGNAAFMKAGIRGGFHNHATEWKPVDGVKPMQILAKETDKKVILQLDIGTCIEVDEDPVAWIKANPGRIVSIHCKEYSKKDGVGYKALFGEGDSPWKKIFQAAEKKGGVEFYLIEQEGSRFSSMESAEKCLAAFKKIYG